MPGGLATWQELLGREGREGQLKQTKYKDVTLKWCKAPSSYAYQSGHFDYDNEQVDFHNDGVPSPPPPHPILYLPGLPDYGFYSAPSDQRGGPCSFADYGSLGPQAAQMLHSEHATSACNSPLQHLHSPDQFKNPGLYLSIYLIHILDFSVWFMTFFHADDLIFFIHIYIFSLTFVEEKKSLWKMMIKKCLADKVVLHVLPPFFFLQFLM